MRSLILLEQSGTKILYNGVTRTLSGFSRPGVGVVNKYWYRPCRGAQCVGLCEAPTKSREVSNCPVSVWPSNTLRNLTLVRRHSSCWTTRILSALDPFRRPKMAKEAAEKGCTLGERTTAGKEFVSGEGYAAARRWVRFVQLHYAVNLGVSPYFA